MSLFSTNLIPELKFSDLTMQKSTLKIAYPCISLTWGLFIKAPVLEPLNKMELLREKIDILLKLQGAFCLPHMLPQDFGVMLYLLLPIS